MMDIYTVHAYRFGDREMHSYTVGVYSDRDEAIRCAYAEEEWRGGNKYACEVLRFDLGGKSSDGSPGLDHEIIKPLPPSNMLTHEYRKWYREQNG
jgi:hypothetical protein